MALIVIDPGLSTTVQDEGRPGYREWGVPLGGAFDRGSAELANALLGNPPAAPCWNSRSSAAHTRPMVRWPWPWPVHPWRPRSSGRIRPSIYFASLSFSLHEGEHLILGRTLAGARTYLAVKGGWQTTLHTGQPLVGTAARAGDILPAESGRRSPLGDWRARLEVPAPTSPSASSRALTAVSCGDDEAFWSVRRFQVGSQSNRMGLRLQGDPLAIKSPARAALDPGSTRRRPGGGRPTDCAGGRLRHHGRLSPCRPCDLSRSGPARPAQTGRCDHISPCHTGRGSRSRSGRVPGPRGLASPIPNSRQPSVIG